MEQLTETVELDLEESNDLTFKIKMEGTAMSPAKVRLVCENNDFAYMFNGYGTGEDEVVQFTIPRMDKRLSEGNYRARVEVLVDNRYFAPLQFNLNFKKTLSVVAEAIQVVKRQSNPEVTVTATSLISSRPAPPAVSTIKFEKRPEQQVAKNESFVQEKSEVEKSEVVVPQSTTPTSATTPGSLRDAFLRKTSQEMLQKSLREKFSKQQ